MNPREYALMRRAEEVHWWYVALRELIKNALPEPRSSARLTLLDMGCGTGATLQHLPPDFLATGIDIAPQALSFCRDRGLQRLIQGSVLVLPFRENTFDLALSMDVLYHRQVNDAPAALREIRRILRPGGHVLINVPAYQWMYSSHDDAIHTGHRFTRTELVRLLQSAGFQIVSASYWNSALFPLVAITRLLRKKHSRNASDLDALPSPLVNGICGTALRLERYAMRRVALPFGSSIFVCARAGK